jgi:hypothetical protein
VRGGIERYLKTYPQGGYWKGKNYLFDRRFEQQPQDKTDEELQKDVESWCAVCGEPWDLYRGQFRCPEPLCKVPVLVCYACNDAKAYVQKPPYCPLCVDGVHLRPLARPDTVEQKRKLYGGDVTAPVKDGAGGTSKEGQQGRSKRLKADGAPSNKLFVGNLPRVVTASK